MRSYTLMHIYVCIYVCIYMYTHTHTNMNLLLHTHTRIHIHTHAYVYTHTHTNTNLPLYTHIRIHTHTHTHTNIGAKPMNPEHYRLGCEIEQARRSVNAAMDERRRMIETAKTRQRQSADHYRQIRSTIGADNRGYVYF